MNVTLTYEQTDAIQEVLNIGVGRAAGILNGMLQAHISLQVPVVKLVTTEELESNSEILGSDHLAGIRMNFDGVYSGTAAIVFPPDSASNLVSLLTEDEPAGTELDSIRVGALTEVGNIIINGVMGTISNLLESNVAYSLPTFVDGPVKHLFTNEFADTATIILLANATFSIEEYLIQGNIVLLLQGESLKVLLDLTQV